MAHLSALRQMRLLGIAVSLAVSVAPTKASGQTTPETVAPPVLTAAAPCSERIWRHGIGTGFRRGARQAAFSLGAGWGYQASKYHHDHDLVLATMRLGRTLGANWEVLGELFGGVQLDLTIHDRFGAPVKPREWFLVPLPVIDEAVQRIMDGSIDGYAYDPLTASLVPQS